MRILLELGMASAIVLLLLSRPSLREDRIRKTPVPDRKHHQFPEIEKGIDLILVPRKIYTFHNDPKYTREDMFFNESATLHTLHNWIELSSGMTPLPYPSAPRHIQVDTER
jgi:hypothetical protein